MSLFAFGCHVDADVGPHGGKGYQDQTKMPGVADGVFHVRMGAVHDGAYIKDQMILSKGEDLAIDGCMLAGNNAVPKKHE